MSPLNLAAHLGQGEFLAQVLHRQYRHVPAAIEAPDALITWDALNDILATHRMDPPRLRLSKNGEMLPQYRYSVPVVTRRRTVWQRTRPAELHTRLAEGASLVVDAIDELHLPVGHAAAELEQWLRAGVQVNLYASWTPTEGFGVHWDDHDVLVIQVDGSKRWKIYGPTRVAPMHKDTSEPDPPPKEPVAELVLNPGDLLYLPRGWWHSVSASEGERSMHLTFGMQTHTGAGLLAWLADELRGREVLRRDLPVHASPEEQAEYIDQLRKEVATAFDAPGLIGRYISSRDGTDDTRLRPSLPYVDGLPADPLIRVRLTTGRAELSASPEGDGVVFRATDNEWELDDAAAPLLRALMGAGSGSVTLGELASAAGVTLDDVASLVWDLIEGHAVTVDGGPS
ncbi:cupin domain-containing protein [Streptomyces radicis]|uniref:Cupin n=1 Tax=Streptomyces radicis TaxID=1750517 RepID=A0A3A9W8L2_9ACTN|nr:cupin domain-containing protein [Streptomyces radicis]RKN09621.1 cupin [Streptomyces radicis]